MSYVIKALAFDDNVRIYAADTTKLVEDARLIHDTWPTATAALGRFLTISSMMGLMQKDNEELSLEIKGTGDINKMIVKVKSNGYVKGDIYNPHVYYKYEDGPLKGKLNVKKAIGEGFLTVTKDLKMKQSFTSQVELVSSEISEDFIHYFNKAEQIATGIGAGVLVDTDLKVLSSGGFIIQLLPGVKVDKIDEINNNISKIKSISKLLNENNSPLDIIKIITNDNYRVLSKHEVKYECNCSKDYYYKNLSYLNIQTLNELKEDNETEIVCHYCKKKYSYTKNEIDELIIEKVKSAIKE